MTVVHPRAYHDPRRHSEHLGRGGAELARNTVHGDERGKPLGIDPGHAHQIVVIAGDPDGAVVTQLTGEHGSLGRGDAPREASVDRVHDLDVGGGTSMDLGAVVLEVQDVAE